MCIGVKKGELPVQLMSVTTQQLAHELLHFVDRQRAIEARTFDHLEHLNDLLDLGLAGSRVQPG